ncbi:cytochrome b/b6 domain-containing protein [Shewanella marina]|uniref:cytochrome b/b6 domain-containing protein n=1 Tax=Shewanella marina TaxID=487319 RepID=UPI00056090CB|nr:cytochrome b/b6 domain-containing protein [Shewanella marina]
MKLISAFKAYINDYFPTLEIKYIHALLALLVIVQIINSNFVHMSHTGQIEQSSIGFLWLHIILGIMTVITTIGIIRYMLVKQSFKQFFPYLYGDNHVLKDDIKQLQQGHLPQPRDQGIANIVQGLGVAALIIIEVSALIWLVLWLSHSAYANDFRELHKTLTGLIEIYLIAHGGMAILHFYIERKKYIK